METIVCLGSRHWDSLWRTTHQVLSRLTDRYNVVYLEPGRSPGGPQLNHAIKAIATLRRVSTSRPLENLTVVRGVPNIPQFRTHAAGRGSTGQLSRDKPGQLLVQPPPYTPDAEAA